ncbi:lantibiotic lacticin [Glycomyces fuscus]|nr:lantibiotic lacticin [Glycomyces fuscus]
MPKDHEGDIELTTEINEQEFDDPTVGGSGEVGAATISSWLGNDGKLCTATVECMPTCN